MALKGGSRPGEHALSVSRAWLGRGPMAALKGSGAYGQDCPESQNERLHGVRKGGISNQSFSLRY